MSRFPYFANMIESGMKESKSNEIEIKEDDVAAFSEIIRYVYCDQLPKDMKNDAMKLLPLHWQTNINCLNSKKPVKLNLERILRQIMSVKF